MYKVIKYIIKIALTAVMLAYVLKNINTEQLGQLIESANFTYLILALLATLASTLISSRRLAIYLSLNKSTAASFYYQGMLFNTILPGGISGDAYIVWKLKDSGIKRIVQILLLNRANGLFFLNLLLYGFVLASQYASLPYVKIAVAILFFAQIAVYFYISRKFLGEDFALFIKTAPYSASLQIFSVLSYYFIFLAFAGKNAADYIAQFIAASIASILPLTPGGMGVREFVFYQGSKIINADIEFAVATSIIYTAIYFLTSLIGFYFLISKHGEQIQKN